MKLIEVHDGIQANFDFFKDIATFSNSQTAINLLTYIALMNFSNH